MNKLIALLALIMVSQAYAQTAVQVVPAPHAQSVYAQPAQAVTPVYQVQPQAAQFARNTMVYDERTNQLVDAQASQPTVQTVPSQAYSAGSPAASAMGNNPIVILNNQRVGQQAVQEMPVSVVEDTPLKASAADNMRKKRQATEVGTEDSIVQALERARMEDEMRRRDRFNNALQPVETPAPAPTPIYVQPAPQPQIVQQVAPPPAVIVTPVVIEKKKEVIVDTPAQDEDMSEKAELRESYKAERRHRDDDQQYYVGALVGTNQASNSTNVHGGLNTGVQIGVILPSRLVLEGDFNYASYSFDDVYNYGQSYDVKQYGLGLAAKYQLLPGRIRPVVGVAGAWARRSFDYGYGNFEVRTSDAFDIGPVVGLDIAVSDSFSIGVDVRYFTNVFYRDSSTNNNSGYAYGYQSQPWGTKAPEKTDYYTASVVAKFLF